MFRGELLLMEGNGTEKHDVSIEQEKKGPCLLGVYRGLYYPYGIIRVL